MSSFSGKTSSEPASRAEARPWLPRRFANECRRHARSWGLYTAGAFVLLLALGEWGLSPETLFAPGNTNGLALVAFALAFFFAATASGLEEGRDETGERRGT